MKKIRVGIIGAGWFAAQSHIPTLAQRGDVVLDSACRKGQEELRRLSDEFGIPFTTEDYRELLARELDAVIVSSPNHLHFEHAKGALERGLHVLCEKPMTLNPADAWELVRIAEERKLCLLVAHGWHYKPGLRRARELLMTGALGEIRHVSCTMASGTREIFLGPPENRKRWKTAFFRPDRSTWQNPIRGGGFAHGQLSHAAGLLFWISGLRASSVQCRMSDGGATVDLYNAATVTFDNGALGVMSGAATLPDHDRSQIDLRIFGDDGALVLDLERERLEVRRHDGRHVNERIEPGAWAYSCEGPANALVDLALGKGENLAPGEVGARTVELIDAMHRSAARSGASTMVSTAP